MIARFLTIMISLPYAAIPRPGYRALFSNVELVQQLLESFVHESWVKDIDFSQASLFNTSVISPAYQKQSPTLSGVYPHHRGRCVSFSSTGVSVIGGPVYGFRMLQYIIQLYHSLKKQNPKRTSLPRCFCSTLQRRTSLDRSGTICGPDLSAHCRDLYS
jgi:hypothetical protein